MVVQMDVRTKSDALTYKWIDLDDMSHENLLQHFDDAHSFIGPLPPSLYSTLRISRLTRC